MPNRTFFPPGRTASLKTTLKENKTVKSGQNIVVEWDPHTETFCKIKHWQEEN